MSYLELLLDLAAEGADRTVARSLRLAPAPELKPTNAFVLKVICDHESKVVIVACADGGGYEVIGEARFGDEGLRRMKRRADKTVPTDYQWGLVEAALQANREALRESGDTTVVDVVQLARGYQRRAKPSFVDMPIDAPTPIKPVLPPRARRKMFAIAGATAVVLAGIVLFVALRRTEPAAAPPPAAIAPAAAPTPPPPTPMPTPPPPPEPATFVEALAASRGELAASPGELGPPALTRYASTRLRWPEVDAASETTVPHVLKDWQAELGKRLCVDGTIVSIERRDVEARKVFVGALSTSEGDRIEFVAVGTTGDLVRRSAARFCGVVTGHVRLLGMFDLPENRQPVVEH